MSAEGESESAPDSPTMSPTRDPGWGPPVGGLGESTQQHEWREALTQGDPLRPDLADNLRVVTLNIRGGLGQKIETLCSWMQQMSVDMLLIQEHNCSDRTLKGIHLSLKGRYGVYAVATPNLIGGAAVLLPKRWVLALQQISTSDDGRTVAVDLLTKRCRRMRCVSTYGPSGHRERTPEELGRYLEGLRTILSSFRQQYPDGRMILGGDFNMVENYALDRTSTTAPVRGQTAYEHSLIQLLEESLLTDAFRTRHPRLRAYTYSRRHGGRTTAARLDRIYLDVAPGLEAALHVSTYVEHTDHLPVLADVCHSVYLGVRPQRYQRPPKRDPKPQLNDVDRNDPRWEAFSEATRMDGPAANDQDHRSLDGLTDVLFTQALRHFPPQRKEVEELSDEDRHVRNVHFEVTLLRRASRLQAHDWSLPTTRAAMRTVCRRLDRAGVISLRLNQDGLEADSATQLRRLMGEKTVEWQRGWERQKRRRIRERVQNRLTLFETRQTSAWYRRIALRQSQPVLTHSVCTERDGVRTFTTDPALVKPEIARRFRAISSRATAPPTPEARAWGARVYVDTPPVNELMAILRPIDREELDRAISRLPSGKAAGPDGVVAELYKHAHHTLREALLPMFNAILEGGPVPRAWSHGLVYPVPKAEGIPSVENSRPISLLSTQRKLFERILCDRLTPALEKLRLLHDSQYGFTPNRSTYTPLFLLNAALEQARDTNCPLYGVLFDVSKAFDTVPEEGLDRSMRLLGFPHPLRRLLLDINGNATAQVITSHGLTESFEVERGVRQGSILSPILWRIFMDPLLKEWHAQRDPFVLRDGQGCTLPLRGQAYADDAAGFASSLEGLQARIHAMTLFCSLHGIRLNLDKSELFTNRDIEDATQVEPLTILGSDEPFRYLGIYFTLQLGWAHQEARTADRLRRLATELEAKKLTYPEAAILYKAAVVPVVAYVGSIAGLSDTFLRRWDSVFGRILLNKLAVGQGTARAVLYGGETTLGLRLPSLLDVRNVQHVSEALLSLNTPGRLGKAAEILVTRLQFARGLHDFPFHFPSPKGLRRDTLMARVWHGLTTFKTEIAAPDWRYSFRPRQEGPGSALLRDLLPPNTPPVLLRALAEARRFFLEDVMDADRRYVAYVGTRGRSPRWYRVILQTLADTKTRRIRGELLRPRPVYAPKYTRAPLSLPEPTDEPRTRWIAIDGALKPGDEFDGRAATASCEFVDGACVEQRARRLNHIHLTSMDVEAAALVEALRMTPSNCALEIVLDSQAVRDKILAVTTGPPPSTRQWLNSPCRAQLVEIIRILGMRTAPTAMTIVKAHTRDEDPPRTFLAPVEMNWYADRAAKAALEQPAPQPTELAADELSFSLVVQGSPWPRSPRAALWSIARTLHDERWMSKRRMGCLTRRYLSGERHPTADVPLFRRLTRKHWNNRLSSFMIKLWLNVLPTSSVLALRGTEEMDMCTFCDGHSRETNTHTMIGCPHWSSMRSDMLGDLADRMTELLGRPAHAAMTILNRSGILDTADIWFGLFPNNMLGRIAPNFPEQDGLKVMQKLHATWNRDILPRLWRERCRQKKEPDAEGYVQRRNIRIEPRLDERELDRLETDCAEDRLAQRTLASVADEGLIPLRSDGQRLLADFEPIRDCIRLHLAGHGRSLYIRSDRWRVLAEGSMGVAGPHRWSVPYFHGQLLSSYRSYVQRQQTAPPHGPSMQWRLPTSLHDLCMETLRTRVELFASPFNCHTGYRAWFTGDPVDCAMGFLLDGLSPTARRTVVGTSSIGNPPYEPAPMLAAVEMAARVIDAVEPTRILLTLPSWRSDRYTHVDRALELGGHLLLRVSPGYFRFAPPYELRLVEWEEALSRPCDWPVDFFLFENEAASHYWRPADDMVERWERWAEDHLRETCRLFPALAPATPPDVRPHPAWTDV